MLVLFAVLAVAGGPAMESLASIGPAMDYVIAFGAALLLKPWLETHIG
ncbi:hypothetical protein [Thiogranum longum]|jgi:ABC-type transport system involved in cytochrome c biogenesis permease component